MHETFKYTLTSQQYLSYLRTQVKNAKQYRGFRLLLIISIPTIIICTVLFFSLYKNWLWLCSFIMLGIVWLLYGVPYCLNTILNHRLDQNFLKKIGISGFTETTIHFQDNKLTYNMNGEHAIYYRDLTTVYPLSDIFVFQDRNNQCVLLPYQVFESETQMQDFIKDFEKKWDESRQKESI